MTCAQLGVVRLARENLKRRKYRAGCLIVLVALCSFTIFAGGVFNSKLRHGLETLSGRLGADLLVVPYGYEKDMQVALLRGEPSTFYLKADLTGRLAGLPGVAAASPQLFMASLSAGCCTAKVQLIGFDPATDFVLRPWMQTRLDRSLGPDEVLVGSRIVPGPGEEITFFGRAFKIAAKMDSTGMGFDTSVFMSLEAARNLMFEAGLVSGEAEAIKDYVSSVIIKTDAAVNPKDVANSIFQAYAVDYNLDIVVTKSLLSGLAGKLQHISYVIYGLSGLLWLLAVAILCLVFSVSLNERKRELSLLRILGASRAWLARLILAEALLISLPGACLGIILGSLVVFPFDALIFNYLSLPPMPITGAATAGLTAFSLLVGALAGPLAAINAVLSITRFDTYSTLREAD